MVIKNWRYNYKRRSGRAVEGGGLENRWARKGPGGSNPSSSASQSAANPLFLRKGTYRPLFGLFLRSLERAIQQRRTESRRSARFFSGATHGSPVSKGTVFRSFGEQCGRKNENRTKPDGPAETPVNLGCRLWSYDVRTVRGDGWRQDSSSVSRLWPWGQKRKFAPLRTWRRRSPCARF